MRTDPHDDRWAHPIARGLQIAHRPGCLAPTVAVILLVLVFALVLVLR